MVLLQHDLVLAQLVSEVIQSDEFLRRAGAAAPVAARLANILPGLVRKKKQQVQQQQQQQTAAVAVAVAPLPLTKIIVLRNMIYVII